LVDTRRYGLLIRQETDQESPGRFRMISDELLQGLESLLDAGGRLRQPGQEDVDQAPDCAVSGGFPGHPFIESGEDLTDPREMFGTPGQSLERREKPDIS